MAVWPVVCIAPPQVPHCTRDTSMPNACAPRFCQVALSPFCQHLLTALPPAWACGVQDLGLGLWGRHGADAAPHLSNKRILSQKWMPLFMGLGAGIWLCPKLERDGWAVPSGWGDSGIRWALGRGPGSSRLGLSRARSKTLDGRWWEGIKGGVAGTWVTRSTVRAAVCSLESQGSPAKCQVWPLKTPGGTLHLLIWGEVGPLCHYIRERAPESLSALPCDNC